MRTGFPLWQDAVVHRRPRAVLGLLTAVFAVVTSLPYWIAHERAPETARPTGLALNSFDQYYYVARIRSAANDLKANRFTSEPDAPGPIAPMYSFVGEVAGRSPLSEIAAYHAFRVLAAAVLPLTLFTLFRRCFQGRTTVALIAVGLSLFAVGIDADQLPEATILYSAMTQPHFTLAYLGFTLALVSVVSAWLNGTAFSVVAAGAAAGLLLGITHTFLLLPVVLVLTVLGVLAIDRAARRLVPWQRPKLLIASGISIMLPAVPFVISLRRELTRFEALQGTPFPATPWDAGSLLRAHGILVPLFLAGLVLALWRSRKLDRQSGVLAVLVLWVALQGILSLADVLPFQRRFSEGLIVPVAAIAAVAVVEILHIRIPLARAAAALVAAILVIGVAGAVSRTANSASYIGDGSWQALQQVSASDVVLAGDRLAELIPAFSDGTVYLGRRVETIRWRAKNAFRARVASKPAEPEHLVELERRGINMVVVDVADPTFPLDPRSAAGSCLHQAFQFSGVVGFRVACPAIPRG